jgi:hypothetical protein
MTNQIYEGAGHETNLFQSKKPLNISTEGLIPKIIDLLPIYQLTSWLFIEQIYATKKQKSNLFLSKSPRS